MYRQKMDFSCCADMPGFHGPGHKLLANKLSDLSSKTDRHLSGKERIL